MVVGVVLEYRVLGRSPVRAEILVEVSVVLWAGVDAGHPPVDGFVEAVQLEAGLAHAVPAHAAAASA